MTYRDDLAALEARHEALELEVAHKTQELDQAARLLDEAREKTRLPVLANLRVATPCPADWNAMTGDDRVRHCGECQKHVYNLSDLTRDEAEALIRDKAGRLCATYYQRKDGTILLKDCAVGIVRRRRRRVVAAGAVALLAGGGAVGYHVAHRGPEQLMGQVTFDDPAAPRTEYRVVQGVEEPPDELEVHVVGPRHPALEKIEEFRTAGVMIEAAEPDDRNPLEE